MQRGFLMGHASLKDTFPRHTDYALFEQADTNIHHLMSLQSDLSEHLNLQCCLSQITKFHTLSIPSIRALWFFLRFSKIIKILHLSGIS